MNNPTLLISCLDNFFSLTTIIRNENAEGRSVFSAFLDMKKAFDWINYKLNFYQSKLTGKSIIVLNGDSKI